MKKIMDLIAEELAAAFEAAGYDREYAKVTLSNRPDLCEYQCNGAMAGAKAYRKAPIMIANDVAARLGDSPCLEEVNAVNPGFINMKIKKEYLADYLNQMSKGTWGLRRRKSLSLWSWTTAGRMWRSRFMWDISVLQSSARESRGLPKRWDTVCWGISIWATGDTRWA